METRSLQQFTLAHVTVIILYGINLSLGSYENHDHVITVDPIFGEDIETCANGSGIMPCKTLGWALKSEYRRNSTLYVLNEGQHILNTSTETFEQLNSLAFVGNSSNVMIYCTVENSGLAFQEVVGVHFKSLTFFNCSALRNSTSIKRYDPQCYEMYQTRVALYFYSCSNVGMVRVNVTHSPNATGVLMYNTDGTNFFQNSTFEYNQLSEGETEIPGGGGFYVEFTYCIPSSGSCSCPYQNYPKMPVVITEHNSHSTYTFENCTFSNNIANSVDQMKVENSSNYIIPNKQSHVAFGRGGGLSIMIKGNAYGNSFNVSKCTFRDNHAIWGGGLLTSFMDVSLNNTLIVIDTGFHNNSCLPKHGRKNHGTGGGGMRIGHIVFQTQTSNLTGNRVIIRHCNYTRNHALSGGGLSISPALQFYKKYRQLIMVNISHSHFEENTAKIGAALEATLFPIAVSGGPPGIYIIDCRFVVNKLFHDKNDSTRETGIGAVYGNGIILHFVGKVHFMRNNGSALAVVGKRVSFENCTALFIGNTGRTGGAINLLGVTYILVNDNTSMNFIRNKAEVYGGAISNTYIGRDYIITNPNCFVRHRDSFRNPDEWRATFYFEDNLGSTYGNDTIHTTSKYPCAWPGWGGIRNNIMCSNNWEYCRENETRSCESEIRTNTGSIEFTSNSTTENKSTIQVFSDDFETVSDIYTLQNHSLSEVQAPLKVIPGKAFQLPLQVKDDFHHNMTATTVFAARTLNMNVSQIDPHFIYTAGGYLRLNGISKNTVEVHLDTLSQRTWHIELQVELLECPPGFVLSDEPPRHNSTCKCNPNNYQKRLRCDQSDFMSLLRNGYWMGTTPESNSSLVVSLCLPGFCVKNNSADYFVLPPTVKEINTQVCQNRTGILCGQCVPSYGPAVNRRNFECIPCNDTNNAAHTVYYVLAVYAPLLILFTGIIVFNVRLTTGPANAFIFYSQIIASTFDLTGDDHIPLNLISQRMTILLSAYRVPYGIFNLDFLENFIKPLCLGTGLNALDTLQLDYIVAAFPLIMILLVLLALKIKSYCKSLCCTLIHSRRQHLQDYISEVQSPTVVHRSRVLHMPKCKWFQNWQAGESLLHAFSAFLLLSYTKFALTSSYIVNLHPILGANGSQIGPRRAYYAGHFTEHDTMYLWRYYVPSCFIIVIIGVIPIMLLGYPIIWLEKCIYKIEWLWRLYPVTKIHVFMDTFQGCYRDDRRFFAAMYFLFRLSINVGYILTDTWLQQFVMQQIACTVFIVIFVLCWPYREEKWLFNYVDFLMLANLATVNALSLYLFAFSQTNHGISLPRSAFWVQYVLVFLPLIYMVMFIVWYLLPPSKKEKITKFISKYTNLKVQQNQKRHRIVHQSSAPNFIPSSVNTNSTSTGEHHSTANNTQYCNTVRPTIITASELDFIEEESYSGSDEEEAMLVRARDRNRYKPPKLKADDKNKVKQPQQRYIKRDFRDAESQNDEDESGDDYLQKPRNGVDEPCHKTVQGCGRDQDGRSEEQQQNELTTKDSGFASSTGGRDTMGTLSQDPAGLRDLCANEKQEICSSSPNSPDYGTMYS